MKHLSLLAIFGLTAVSVFGGEDCRLARVTVYWRGENQLHASWNGARLRNGHCAVDPKKIPYGSKVFLGGDVYVAVDTGPAVVSRKAARSAGRTASERNAIVIDLFFERKEQATAWTKTHPHFIACRIEAPGNESDHGQARLAAKTWPGDINSVLRGSWDLFPKALEPDRVMLASSVLR